MNVGSWFGWCPSLSKKQSTNSGATEPLMEVVAVPTPALPSAASTAEVKQSSSAASDSVTTAPAQTEAKKSSCGWKLLPIVLGTAAVVIVGEVTLPCWLMWTIASVPVAGSIGNFLSEKPVEPLRPTQSPNKWFFTNRCRYGIPIALQMGVTGFSLALAAASKEGINDEYSQFAATMGSGGGTVGLIAAEAARYLWTPPRYTGP